MRKRILLVENDDDIAHIVSVVASGEGWELLRARTGEEAIALWTEARPDLILLDLKLGQLDGVDVFHHIRRSLGMAPRTLILSAASQADMVGRALNVSVVHKPFAIAELVSAVREALEASDSSLGR